MRKVLFISILCSLSILAKAQWPATFVKYYDAPFDHISNHSYSVVQTKDAGFAFVGESVIQTGTTTFSSKGVIYKTNNAGQVLWKKVIDSMILNSIAELKDSSLIMCGESTTLYIVKTDKGGNVIWSRKPDLWLRKPKIRMTLDGGSIVQGIWDGPGPDHIGLVKFNALGNIMWEKQFDQHAYYDMTGHDVTPLPDSGYILTGTTDDPMTTGPGAFFIRTDKNGDTLWSRSWIKAPGESVRMRSVIPTSDGGFIATGGNVLEGIVLKLDVFGNEVWRKYLPMADGMGIYEDTGKAYYVFTFTTSPDYQCSLHKISYGGDSILWVNRYGSYAPQYPEAFARTSEGGFVLTGYGRDSVNATKAMLVKVDSIYTIVTRTDLISPGRDVRLFPDPAGSAIMISADMAGSPPLNLRIFDMTGKIIIEQDIVMSHTTITTDRLPNALYLYSVSEKNGRLVKSGKMSIRR